MKLLLGECQSRGFNIGSGNGLVPSGNKPLPEPVLTYGFTRAQWVNVQISTWMYKTCMYMYKMLKKKDKKESWKKKKKNNENAHCSVEHVWTD